MQDLKELLEIVSARKASTRALALEHRSVPCLSAPRLLTCQGWKHFDRGNFKEARQAYNIAVQKNPDNPHCYHLRGQCYLMQGLYEEAMAEFSTAIKVNPRCAGELSGTVKQHSDA